MGFMGIKHYKESDGAADWREKLRFDVNKLFWDEMKDEANAYNTPGWLNILLILKEFPDFIHFVDYKLCEKIWKRIDKDTNENGYLWHLGGKALVQNFKRLCKEEDR
jgi:hypothetical protein